MKTRLLTALAILLLASPGLRADSVGSEALRSLVEARTRETLEGSTLVDGASRVEIEAGALDSRLQLAACPSPLQVDVDLGRAVGRINARVRCLGATPWSIYVPVQIRAYRPVVVATRTLQADTPIQAADVTLEERDTLASGSRALLRLDEAVGRNARRTVQAHSVLSEAAVEHPVLVKRGERISLSARSGGISVVAGGEALGDGRSGDRVRVRNLQSRRVVEGTVTGPGTVEVI